MEDEISKFRKGLAILRSGMTYLNHASVGPLHDEVVSAVTNGLKTQMMQASLAQWDWFEAMDIAREECAKLVGASQEDIALMPNTSTGIMRAVSSIPFEPGDEVIWLADEFPALYWPLYSLTKQGVKLVPVNRADGLDLTSSIIQAVNAKTKLVAVSWVGFLSGARVDLRALSEEKKRADFYILVDGMQGVGAVPIDLSQLDIDFLAVHGAKWLMAPVGIGFLYASRSARKLVPQLEGWYGHEIDWDCFLRRDTALQADARRFEIASPPFSLVYGLISACRELNRLGLDFVWKRIQMLTDSLFDGLKELGFQVITPKPHHERAGIVTFKCQKAKETFEALERKRIIISYREGAIRVSPHFWNTEEEISLLLNELAGK